MSAISSIGSNANYATQVVSRHRPNAGQMAEKLFAKLDRDGQGFIEKTDLQQALDSLRGGDSGTATSGASDGVDELFSTLDGNSDGKVTKDEFSSALKKVTEQLDQQFMSLRMSKEGGIGGTDGATGPRGMPPPPRGDRNDEGLTKEELSSQLKEVGNTDRKGSELMSKIVNNFDAADTDGNGKVSFQEAMAYDKANPAASSASADSASTATSTDSATQTASADNSRRMMQQIIQLMHAYGSGSDQAPASSSLLASA